MIPEDWEAGTGKRVPVPAALGVANYRPRAWPGTGPGPDFLETRGYLPQRSTARAKSRPATAQELPRPVDAVEFQLQPFAIRSQAQPPHTRIEPCPFPTS